MSTLLLRFDIGNSAFGDFPQIEVARILRDLADKIDARGLPGGLECFAARDINGNRIGALTVEEDQ